MNVKFIINDYLIAWNILFSKSTSEEINKLNFKIWKRYKNEYDNLKKENKIIMNDCNNYIPDNDTVFHAVMDTDIFDKLRKEPTRTKTKLLKTWDKNIKKINHFYKDVLRIKLPDYKCFIINKDYNVLNIEKNENQGFIILGKEYNNDNDYLINIMKRIVKEEIHIKEEDKLGVKDAVIELAVTNEFATMLYDKTCYDRGSFRLIHLKKQIYPYWLMYLGIPKEDMVEYIKRDKMSFDDKKHAYEKELININLEQFIDFIIRNQRYIIKVDKLSDIEELD